MSTHSSEPGGHAIAAPAAGSTGRSGAATRSPLPHVAVELEGLDGDRFVPCGPRCHERDGRS